MKIIFCVPLMLMAIIFSSNLPLKAQSSSQTTLPLQQYAMRASPATSPDAAVVYVNDVTNLYAYSGGSSPSLLWTMAIYDGANNPYSLTPYQLSLEVYGSPAVGSNGIIYVGSMDGNLYAINTNGTIKWTFYATNAIACTPAIGSNGTIYFGDESGNLYAVDTAGSLLTGYPVQPSYVSDPSGHTYTILPEYFGSPVIGVGGIVYIVGSYSASGNNVLAFLGTNYIGQSENFGVYGNIYDGGSNAFSADFADTISPSVGPDGTIYVGAADGYLTAGSIYAFDPLPNDQHFLPTKWSYQTGTYEGIQEAVTTTPIIDQTDVYGQFAIYFGTSVNKVYRLTCDSTGVQSVDSYQLSADPSSGRTQPIFSTPALDSDGNLYVASGDGHFYSMTANNLSAGPNWSIANPVINEVDEYYLFSSPVIATNGFLYIAGNSDESSVPTPYEYLRSVNIGYGAASAPWPMWRKNSSLNASNNLSLPLFINIQFLTHSSTQIMSGVAGTGLTPTDYWNVLQPISFNASSASVSNLKDIQQNLTGVGASDYGTTGGTSLGATSLLMNNALFDSSGSDVGVVISSLPAGTYDFYLYGAGPIYSSQTLNATFSFLSGVSTTPTAQSTSSSLYDVDSYVEGNQYVVFRNVQTTGADITIDAAVPSYLNPSTYFNGLQIRAHQ